MDADEEVFLGICLTCVYPRSFAVSLICVHPWFPSNPEKTVA
jgi:hypothetical protein